MDDDLIGNQNDFEDDYEASDNHNLFNRVTTRSRSRSPPKRPPTPLKERKSSTKLNIYDQGNSTAPATSSKDKASKPPMPRKCQLKHLNPFINFYGEFKSKLSKLKLTGAQMGAISGALWNTLDKSEKSRYQNTECKRRRRAKSRVSKRTRRSDRKPRRKRSPRRRR